MTDIAIVGGGAAGASVFGELLRRSDYSGTIHWITGCVTPGRGVAYATEDDSHLLNVRASSMGLLADQKDDFFKYASNCVDPVYGTDFLPRRLFGEFIEAQLRGHMSEARAHGVRFQLHRAKAVAVFPASDQGYRIKLEHGDLLSVDAVVLAIGALAPRALKTVTAKALNSSAYTLDPWKLDKAASSPRSVLVIGTGLTAIDTLISAATRWPQANLVAVSRHGLLPFHHATSPLAPYPRQDALNAALLMCEGIAPMVHLVREAISESPRTDWRAVIDGMRTINAQLWQKLTTMQRRQFLRHVRWVWESSRHRTAPTSYESIRVLIENKRLHVHAARVLNVDGSGPLTVSVRSRATQLIRTMKVDRVIQATGLDTAVAYARDPLMAQLLGEGLVVPDQLQLGVSAEPDGRLLDAEGSVQAGLYGIGSLLRGNLWECTAMPEIRIAASKLVKLIVSTSSARGTKVASRA